MSAGGGAFLFSSLLHDCRVRGCTLLNARWSFFCRDLLNSVYGNQSLWYHSFVAERPNSQPLWETMSMCSTAGCEFRVAVKVFINRQCSLLVPALTWWNYKHGNTVELLICEIPPGAVPFITKTWRRRLIDKHIAWLAIRGYCLCRQELWCCWHTWPFTRIS